VRLPDVVQRLSMMEDHRGVVVVVSFVERPVSN